MRALQQINRVLMSAASAAVKTVLLLQFLGMFPSTPALAMAGVMPLPGEPIRALARHKLQKEQIVTRASVRRTLPSSLRNVERWGSCEIDNWVFAILSPDGSKEHLYRELSGEISDLIETNERVSSQTYVDLIRGFLKRHPDLKLAAHDVVAYNLTTAFDHVTSSLNRPTNPSQDKAQLSPSAKLAVQEAELASRALEQLCGQPPATPQ